MLYEEIREKNMIIGQGHYHNYETSTQLLRWCQVGG